MPSLMPVLGVARVAFRGTSAGQAVVNVFHVQCGVASLSQATIDALCTGMKTAYEANLVTRLQGSWSGDTVTAQDLSSDTGVTKQMALAGTPGSVIAASPNSLACCITWKINRHYRGGHPRTYLGPIPNTFLENQTTFLSTAVANILGSANAFLTAVNGITLPSGTPQMVGVHRVRSGAVLPVPLVSPIVAVAVDSRVDTMRRRLGRDR
jgi:hypothetical protein